jgi:hypothetical protein
LAFLAFAFAMSLQAQTITMQLLPASQVDRNYRVGATGDLSKPFTYQSDVANVPSGGYGFEFGLTHYPDNNPGTPRVFDNNFELWFVTDAQCEGIPNCSTLPPDQRPPGTFGPPGSRNQSALIA